MENLNTTIKPEEIEVLSTKYKDKIIAILEYWLKDTSNPITDSPEIISVDFANQTDMLKKIKEYSSDVVNEWLIGHNNEATNLGGSYDSLKKLISDKIDYDYLKNNKG